MVRRRFSYDVDLGSLPNSVVREFYVVLNSGKTLDRQSRVLGSNPSIVFSSLAIVLCKTFLRSRLSERRHVTALWLLQGYISYFDLAISRLVSAKIEREY